MGVVNIAVNQPTGRTLTCYVKQVSTGFMYRRTTTSFEDVILADIALEDRGPYRNTLVESPPNTYRFTIDSTNWEDGDYSFTIREVIGLVEYPDILVDELEIYEGKVVSESLDLKLSTTPAKTLFAYVKSLSSNRYFNFTTSTLDVIDLATLGAASRNNYRLPYVEAAPGSYTASIPQEIPDGPYSISTVELINGIEIEAGVPSNLNVRDGKALSAPRENIIPINHNTGGVDNLRYVSPNGSGVHNASITVYTTSDISRGIYNNPLGTTVTDNHGRWALPISVESSGAGAYTVVFEKPGHYGPDSVEV